MWCFLQGKFQKVLINSCSDSFHLHSTCIGADNLWAHEKPMDIFPCRPVPTCSRVILDNFSGFRKLDFPWQMTYSFSSKSSGWCATWHVSVPWRYTVGQWRAVLFPHIFSKKFLWFKQSHRLSNSKTRDHEEFVPLLVCQYIRQRPIPSGSWCEVKGSPRPSSRHLLLHDVRVQQFLQSCRLWGPSFGSWSFIIFSRHNSIWSHWCYVGTEPSGTNWVGIVKSMLFCYQKSSP